MLMQKVAVVNSTEEPVTLKEGQSIMSFGKVTYKRIADGTLVDATKDRRFTFLSLRCEIFAKRHTPV